MRSKLKNGTILPTLTIEFYMRIIMTFKSEEDYASIFEMGKKAKDTQYQITDFDILQLLVNRCIITPEGEMNKDVQNIILSSFVYENSDFPDIHEPIISLGETSVENI